MVLFASINLLGFETSKKIKIIIVIERNKKVVGREEVRLGSIITKIVVQLSTRNDHNWWIRLH